MVITYIFALIGAFGTLTIIAYLRQLEDGLAELQNEMDITMCPVCHIPHSANGLHHKHKNTKKFSKYYTRKRKTA